MSNITHRIIFTLRRKQTDAQMNEQNKQTETTNLTKPIWARLLYFASLIGRRLFRRPEFELFLMMSGFFLMRSPYPPRRS
ncbi:hypothetical protein [Roseomonas chloroacetimidivorans]|uniref:hypothetical protein n=1 Tax=Roseomonas chloroacetimidivorans TaxID=1766656 RepID=UPI003C78E1D7